MTRISPLDRGTTNDRLATEGAKGAQIVRFDDDSTLVTAIASGQVEFFATSPSIVKTVAGKAPALGVETKFVMQSFPLGIGLRKGENKLHADVDRVNIEGPTDRSFLEYPRDYYRVFFDGAAPAGAKTRRDYARKILKHFTERAFRRPVDQPPAQGAHQDDDLLEARVQFGRRPVEIHDGQVTARQQRQAGIDGRARHELAVRAPSQVYA